MLVAGLATNPILAGGNVHESRDEKHALRAYLKNKIEVIPDSTGGLKEDRAFWSRLLQETSMSVPTAPPSATPVPECRLEFTQETTDKCEQNPDSRLPLCVGIRGNGLRFWAHFPALARTVEAFGPASGMAGGSSATITGFLFESIQNNPLVLTCGKTRCCSGAEQRARISLLLKSTQAIPSESNVSPVDVLVGILTSIQQQNILSRLLSNDPAEQDAALQDLLDILNQGEIVSLVNPDLINLLLTSPDPVYHAIDILQATNRSLTFDIGDDKLVFIRPYPLSFPGLAELIDVIASFYAGFEPVDLDAMETMLKECAASSVGQEWSMIESFSTPSGDTCGDLFSSLYQDFLVKRDSSHPTRLDDPLGGALDALIATGVLRGNAYENWETATEDYFNAVQNVVFDVDFDDVSFGYYGNEKSLNRVKQKLPALFDDLKSKKFLSLGPTTWRDVLERSPAEPSLSRGIPVDDTQVSVAGWVDPTPVQVLTAMRCDRVVLINRLGSVGNSLPFTVAKILGASPKELDDLYSLENEASSFVAALRLVDATYCVDWDTLSSLDVDALAKAGYTAHLLSDDPCTLSLDVGAKDKDVSGCTA